MHASPNIILLTYKGIAGRLTTNRSHTGHKNPRGTVSIINYKGRVRLRWSYQSKRYSMNLSVYSKATILPAKKVAQIEHDIQYNQFDFTLKKYKGEDMVFLRPAECKIS